MKVRWTRRALADLDRIAARMAEDKPTVAAEFVTTIAYQVGRLSEFSLLGRAGAYQDARELVVHRNYLGTYRIRGNEVQVLQVWHVTGNFARGGGRAISGAYPVAGGNARTDMAQRR